MTKEEFAESLNPLVDILKKVSLDKPQEAKTLLKKEAPLKSKLIQEIRKNMEQGAREGWLLPKENSGIRFGRMSKDLGGFSVDAVQMSTPGPKHRHGNGEIDLCFSIKGNPKFDGHPEGWVVYGPGSVHTPTVSDGEMLILYFLPGGSIEFL